MGPSIRPPRDRRRAVLTCRPGESLTGAPDASALLRESAWPADPTFDALVDCARAGDRHAFREVTERLAPRLLRYVRRNVGLDVHTARDVVQDAFVLAWCNLDHIRDGAHLRPWLYRVARCRAVSCVRRRGPRGQPMLSLDGGLDLEPAPVPAFPDVRPRAGDPPPAGSLLALRRAVRGLRPNHAGVVRLHYLLGLDTAETARLLGVTRGTVKMRLLRARTALRRLVRAHAAELAPQDARDVLRWLDRRSERKEPPR